MSRTTVAILTIALLSAIAQFFLPWWTIAIVAALVTLVLQLKPSHAFFSGLLGVGGLWLAMALFFSLRNHFILSSKLAELFSLSNSVFLLLFTALIGGLTAGMSALTASLFRQALRPPERPFSNRRW